MWAAELPDLLTQDKEHLLKEKAKLRTLLKTVLMDQSGHRRGGWVHAFFGVTFEDDMEPAFEGGPPKEEQRLQLGEGNRQGRLNNFGGLRRKF